MKARTAFDSLPAGFLCRIVLSFWPIKIKDVKQGSDNVAVGM